MRYKSPMPRVLKLSLLYFLPFLLLAGGAVAYQFFVGFPTTFEGRRVRRITVWTAGSHFQRDNTAYVYTGPDGKDVRHGPFQRFDNGKLVQQEIFRDGRLDGPVQYWNLLGEKTQEVYYRAGTPYGWANFASGKLFTMRQEVMQDGRSVAVKTFGNGRYALDFRCGDLIIFTIDPVSGKLSPVANASQRACAQP